MIYELDFIPVHQESILACIPIIYNANFPYNDNKGNNLDKKKLFKSTPPC